MAGTHDLAVALRRWLGAVGVAVAGDAVEELRRLSGGASRETWSFDLVGGGRRRPLILQRQRAGALGTGPSMTAEASLLQRAGAHGVPVPTVVAADAGEALGAAATVVERLEGETIARRILRDDEWATARARLLGDGARALAAIHGIDPSSVELPAADQLDQLRGLLDALGEPHPAFELGIRWLDANRPDPGPPAVVHGDFRLGNLLVGPEGLRAVLDWELSHVGDPVEDLGWFCVRAWRFGAPLPAGGVGTREQLLAAYEAASGRAVDPAALRWWEALGTLKWGVICVLQAASHLRGLTRSVELATIGRRVCENEWDLLALLPGPALPVPGPVDHGADADPSTLHDRPRARELVEAVREWLERDVRDADLGRVSFDARVAARALATVERELRLGPVLDAPWRERLAALGCAGEAELSRRIRAGELDDRVAEVRATVAATVAAKLLVANPHHLRPDA